MTKIKNFYITLCVLIASLVTAQTSYFVSSETGSDSNDGKTWQTAFATVDRAVNLVQNTPGTYYINIATGNYTVSQHTLNGGVNLTVTGGFPVPTATTAPTAACASAAFDYETSLNGATTNSPFRLLNNANSLTLSHLFIRNLTGTVADAALVTVDNGSANSVVNLESSIIQGYHTGQAGMIYVFGATNTQLNINNSWITAGRTIAGLGGGVISVWSGPPYSTNTDINITNSSFSSIETGGTKDTTGSGIITLHTGTYDNGQSSITIDKSYFCINNSNNRTDAGSSPVVAVNVRDVKVTNTIFYRNYSGHAGALSLTNVGRLTSTNNIYYENDNFDNGGAINLDGNYSDQSYMDANPTTFTNDKFYLNKNSVATKNGGAIGIVKDATVIFTGVEFSQNKAQGSSGTGGAIYSTSSKPFTFVNTNFCQNSALSDGGAIFSSGSGTYSFNNVTFSSNTAGGRGGALSLAGAATFSGSSSYFVSNTAGGNGGAVFTNNARANITATAVPVYFDGNTSSAQGGAVFINSATTNPNTFTAVRFSNNKATEGGAIYAAGGGAGTVNVANSYFYKNGSSATGVSYGGGAVYMNAYNYISNSNIYDGNTSAGSGGAVYFGINASAMTFTPTNDIYENNTATNQRGGAIYVAGAGAVNVNMAGNKLYNNSASVGGAVATYAGTGGTVAFNTSEFYSNKAGTQGGAIAVLDIGQAGNEVDAVNGSKFYGNAVNGSVTNTAMNQRSDIYVANDNALTYYAHIAGIANSALQFVANETNYPSGGFALGAGNTQQTSVLTTPAAYTLPSFTAASCTDLVGNNICVAGQEILPPMALINVTDNDGNVTDVVSVCRGTNVPVTISSSTGVWPLTITYHIEQVNLATGAVTASAPVTVVATNFEPLTVNVSSVQLGIQYKVVLQQVVDAQGRTTNYSCDNSVTINVVNCPLDPCDAVPNTEDGPAVKHGITSLQRAGADNGNWPMVRTSAYTVLESKTKGFVPTRINDPETAVINPVKGMMVWDGDANNGDGCLKINTDGTRAGWKCFNIRPCLRGRTPNNK